MASARVLNHDPDNGRNNTREFLRLEGWSKNNIVLNHLIGDTAIHRAPQLATIQFIFNSKEWMLREAAKQITDPAAPGLIPSIPNIFSEEKIIDAAENNW